MRTANNIPVIFTQAVLYHKGIDSLELEGVLRIVFVELVGLGDTGEERSRIVKRVHHEESRKSLWRKRAPG